MQYCTLNTENSFNLPYFMAAVALPPCNASCNVIAYTLSRDAWPFHLEFFGLLAVFNHVTRFKDEKVSLIAC